MFTGGVLMNFYFILTVPYLNRDPEVLSRVRGKIQEVLWSESYCL